MKFSCKTLIAAWLFLCVIASSNLVAKTISTTPGFSSPWHLFWQQLHAAFRTDPCVNVDPLSQHMGLFFIPMRTVCDDPLKAQALSSLFTHIHKVGRRALMVAVYDVGGTLVLPETLPLEYDSLKNVIASALKGNPFYVGVAPPNRFYDAFVVFSQTPIQFFADDFSKPDFFKTMVAADAFGQLMGLCIGSECPAPVGRPKISVSTVLSDPPPSSSLR
jgi:hypothetical protein